MTGRSEVRGRLTDRLTPQQHAGADDDVALPRWMRPLNEKTRGAVRRNVAAAPPLADRQQAAAAASVPPGG